MFTTNYYCLVAGLKEYSLDADTKGFDAKAIVGELAKHDPALVDKPRWLILNKLDLIPEEEREKTVKDFLKAYKKATKYDGPVFTIAAINGEGTKPLIYAIQEALEQMAPVAEEPLESPEDES